MGCQTAATTTKNADKKICWAAGLAFPRQSPAPSQQMAAGSDRSNNFLFLYGHTHTRSCASTQKGTSCVRVQPAGGLPGLPGRRRDFLQLSRVLPALLDHGADISSPRSDVPLSLSNTPPDFLWGLLARLAVLFRSGLEASYQHAAEAAEKGNSYDKGRSTVK